VIEVLRSSGARVLAAASVIDRSGGRANLGVPRVALATLDVVGRFATAHQVAAYLGLTPRERSSSSMTSTHARTMSGATALRTTRNPSVEKSLVDTTIPISCGGFPVCARFVPSM